MAIRNNSSYQCCILTHQFTLGHLTCIEAMCLEKKQINDESRKHFRTRSMLCSFFLSPEPPRTTVLMSCYSAIFPEQCGNEIMNVRLNFSAERYPWGSLGPHGAACLKHPHAHLGPWQVPIWASMWWRNGREREWDGSCAVLRGSSEEGRVVRNGLMLVACLLLVTKVTSGPGMLLMAISGSTTARVYVTTKAMGMLRVWVTTCNHFDVQRPCHRQCHVDLNGLCCHWGTW